ncbi:MAG: hypothetical protein ACI8TX_000645 [Hyphomicrobiaceae bacterium]|jgi:hypothetical protein
MSRNSDGYNARARQAKITMWLGKRASRDTGIVDRLCRKLLQRVTQPDPQNDFMHDEMIESDLGFDAEELARYQRGETGRETAGETDGGTGREPD